MEYVLTAIWSAMDVVAVLLVGGAFLPLRRPAWQGVFAVALLSTYRLIYHLSGHVWDLDFLLNMVLLLTAHIWLYKGKWYHYLLTFVAGYTVLASIDTLTVVGVSAAWGLQIEELLSQHLLYAVACSVGKLVEVFLAWFLLRLRRNRNVSGLSRKWSCLIVLFPAVSLAVFVYMRAPYEQMPDQTLMLSAVLLAANVAILYIITAMEKSERESRTMALLNQQMQLQTESIEALEKSYRTQRKLTHDFKNQLQTLQHLISDGQLQAAGDYICQLREDPSLRQPGVHSRHPIVDAVLNLKSQTAREQGIDLQLQVADLSALKLNTNALVVLLSNLLDNALEAGIQTEEKCIQCRIQLQDSLYLSIRNSSLPVVIREGNVIPTTKTPAYEHGYGLPQCLQLLEMLQAEYTFDYRDGWFTFVAEIPMEK